MLNFLLTDKNLVAIGIAITRNAIVIISQINKLTILFVEFV